MGDARVEFRAGDRLPGRPVATRDRRGFRPGLDRTCPGPLTDLKVPAADGSPELSAQDVDGRWVRDTFDESPAPARPLSRVVPTPYPWAGVPAGERSFEVVVPTVRDGLEGPEESLRLRLITYDEGSWEPREGPVFTGTVRDAP
ncbi:hypothetical protein ACFYXP_25835 [Streptomyces sp. NPDC002466]|uniref:hypothetical protein n=1 Tax=unclassified Streptomyces TaxID=2593676 RepID=UPI001652C503|nr:hypothetical protein [Streptomyces sp. sk2.1]